MQIGKRMQCLWAGLVDCNWFDAINESKLGKECHGTVSLVVMISQSVSKPITHIQRSGKWPHYNCEMNRKTGCCSFSLNVLTIGANFVYSVLQKESRFKSIPAKIEYYGYGHRLHQYFLKQKWWFNCADTVELWIGNIFKHQIRYQYYTSHTQHTHVMCNDPYNTFLYTTGGREREKKVKRGESRKVTIVQ